MGIIDEQGNELTATPAVIADSQRAFSSLALIGLRDILAFNVRNRLRWQNIRYKFIRPFLPANPLKVPKSLNKLDERDREEAASLTVEESWVVVKSRALAKLGFKGQQLTPFAERLPTGLALRIIFDLTVKKALINLTTLHFLLPPSWKKAIIQKEQMIVHENNTLFQRVRDLERGAMLFLSQLGEHGAVYRWLQQLDVPSGAIDTSIQTPGRIIH